MTQEQYEMFHKYGANVPYEMTFDDLFPFDFECGLEGFDELEKQILENFLRMVKGEEKKE